MRDSFGVIHGKTVKVVVRFDKEVAGYIKEKKWHSSQKIEPHKNGSITVTFTIAGTNEIKYWIMSYGHRAEVLEPTALRDEIKDDLLLALKRY
jgi:predicted DNA-binding transcriptional regulator YafY